MKIHRYADRQPPYQVTFERSQENGFYEAVVAGNALGINTPTQELLGLPDCAADAWACLSRKIAYKPEDLELHDKYMTLGEIKILGTTLLHFSDRTKDDLSGISPLSFGAAAARRVEGRMALGMAQQISYRGVRIDRLQSQHETKFVPWHPSIR